MSRLAGATLQALPQAPRFGLAAGAERAQNDR
jgi:hypothetical protein